MIQSIAGPVIAFTPVTASVDIASMVLILCVARTKTLELNKKTTFFISLQWNQETGPTLYGFLTEQERSLFLLLVGCPGIGPKMALTVLAELDDHTIIHAIQIGNEKTFSSISGIGLKKAEQLIMYLKHKIASFIAAFPEILDNNNSFADWHTVIQALESLRYTKHEISSALDYARQKITPEAMVSFDIIMRQALVFLAKQR